jgi:hypothetical protein
MMRVAPSVRNGPRSKSSLGIKRKSYNRLMDCTNCGLLRDVQARLARTTVALAATSPADDRHVVPPDDVAKDKSARIAVC